jgi:5-methylcytosine-specific restriction endonuclease McrA
VCKRRRDQESDAARPSASARGYDTEWQTFSRAWLARYRWCGQRADGGLHGEHSRCVQDGRKTPAQCTDHIVAMKHGGRRFDRGNLQSLCSDCNRRKNIALEGGFGRPRPGTQRS